MARLQDFNTVTPTANDKFLIVQSQGQGLATYGSVLGVKMDKANPTGTGSLSLNRKSGTTTGSNSVAEGTNCTASGSHSHAEGNTSTASNSASHAEGHLTTSSGSFGSHAEGRQATASGENGSHAEGYLTTASGAASHAEGHSTTASGGFGSHSEGRSTTASGETSHAEGLSTISQRRSQHVFGEFNVADTGGTGTATKGTYVEIVGKGTADNARSNARTLDWSGNEVLAGDLTIMGNKSLNTLITNLADVKIGVASIEGGSTLKITGRSGLCCATFNNNNPTCAFYGFSLMAGVFRFRPTDSTDTRLSATRDASTGEITITNGSGSYATIIVVYWS